MRIIDAAVSYFVGIAFCIVRNGGRKMVTVIIVSIAFYPARGNFTVAIGFVEINNFLATLQGYSHDYQRCKFFHSKGGRRI